MSDDRKFQRNELLKKFTWGVDVICKRMKKESLIKTDHKVSEEN